MRKNFRDFEIMMKNITVTGIALPLSTINVTLKQNLEVKYDYLDR